MQYTNLGDTGLQVSRICLGMMAYGSSDLRNGALNEEQSRRFILRALELGINFFDTADLYARGGSEEVTGRALRDFAPREEVVVATKVFYPWSDKPNTGGLSRKHIMSGINGSLKRLGMDYVDLYQIHRWDYKTPIEETMEALHDVIKAGKAHYIGASAMYGWQFAKAQHVAEANGWTPFVSMHTQYNLIYREEEREMIPQCVDMNVGVLPWSPLARGFLAGHRSKGGGSAPSSAYSKADFAIAARVEEIAERYGISPAQVSLAWLLHKEGITAPIIGASQMDHLEQAVEAVEIALADEDIAMLEEPYQTRQIQGVQ